MPNHDALTQLRELSDGTLAALTGFTDSADLQRVRRDAVQTAISAIGGSGAKYESWMDAWRWFENSPAAEKLPAMTRGGAVFTLVFDERKPERVQFLQRDGGRGSLQSAWFESDPSRFGGYLNQPGNLIRKAPATRMFGFLRQHKPAPAQGIPAPTMAP